MLGRLPKQEKRSFTNQRAKKKDLYLFEDTKYISKRTELYFLTAPKLGDNMAHRIIVPKKIEGPITNQSLWPFTCESGRKDICV